MVFCFQICQKMKQKSINGKPSIFKIFLLLKI
jgi:hypothetical protein